MVGGHWTWTDAGVTDGEGRFSVLESRSYHSALMFRRTGYDDGMGGRDFDAASTQDAPTVFQIWKRRAAEPMIHGKVKFDIPFEQEVRFDFLKGRIVSEGGDMVFLLTRQVPTKHGDRDRWHLKISATDGGFEKLSPPIRDAPAIKSRASLDFGAGVSNFPGWLFYVFTRGKLYSHIRVDSYPEYKSRDDLEPQKGLVELEWYTNPGGSKNLEYEASKDVTKQYQEKK